jgi:hypothetical protein
MDRSRTPWYKEEKCDVAKTLWDYAQWLGQDAAYQREADLRFLRLYSNRAVRGLSGHDFTSSIDTDDKIRLNVIQACIDTATAQIAAEYARPLHATVGGDTGLRDKVKKIDQYILGVFHATGHYGTSLDVFRDGGIFGIGYEKFLVRNGRVESVRVPKTEILVDEQDARLGDPRCLYHVQKYADKEQLIAEFAEGDEELADAISRSGIIDTYSYRDVDETRCTVIEGWCKPSMKGLKDGRHVICVEHEMILDEPWEDDFPFAVWRWSTLPFGFNGIGLAELLAPIQVEVNYIAQKIQKLMTLATSMVWLQKGSGVTPITNEDWGQREYRGRPPIFQTTASVSAEYFHHLDRLYNRAFEIAGISQLSASSTKPAGLESGEAIKLYHDIGTMRFRHTGRRWGQYHLDAGERILEASRRALKDGDSPRTLSVGGERVEDLSYSDINVANDKYTVMCYPASLMPEEPAGKVDAISKMAQMDPNAIDMLWGLLEGVPDVKHIVAMKTAERRIIEMQIDEMLRTGRPESPDPLMNLELARKSATDAWMNARTEKVEDEKCEALRQYIEKIDALQAAAAPQFMPGDPAMMGGAPGASPAGPQSAPSEPMPTPPSGGPQF